jgi:flagellar FliL protein
VAIFGVVSLVAIFAAYLLTVKVLKPTMSSTVTPQEQAAEQQAKAAAEAEEKAQSDSHGAEDEHGSAKAAEFYTIESIVVNPAGTAGTRYLSCSVSFELPGKDDLKQFEAKSVKIKDILITIFSSKTVEELADVQKRNAMRRQILTVVNKFVTPARANAVYLTDFVLQ